MQRTLLRKDSAFLRYWACGVMKWLLWQQLSKASIFLRDVLHTASVREENMKTETGGRAKQKLSAAESIRSGSNVPTPGPHHPGLACRPVEKATPASTALKAALGGWGREPTTGAHSVVLSLPAGPNLSFYPLHPLPKLTPCLLCWRAPNPHSPWSPDSSPAFRPPAPWRS